jgi:hypothetical protein
MLTNSSSDSSDSSDDRYQINTVSSDLIELKETLEEDMDDDSSEATIYAFIMFVVICYLI